MAGETVSTVEDLDVMTVAVLYAENKALRQVVNDLLATVAGLESSVQTLRGELADANRRCADRYTAADCSEVAS